jgi:uncharacterized RDD family membrane protein YckC
MNSCPSCQAPLPGTYLKCPSCGWKRNPSSSVGSKSSPSQLGASSQSSVVSQVQAPAAVASSTPTSYALSATADYAGFWQRVGAHLVDLIILFVGQLAIVLILVVISGGSELAPALGYLIAVILALIYEPFFLSSNYQATPGKMALNIKVVDENNGRLSFIRALGRSIVKQFVSGILTLGLGFLAAAFTKRKQALHDLMIGSVVLRA